MNSYIGQVEKKSAWPLIETMSSIKSTFSWNNIRPGSEALSYDLGQIMQSRGQKGEDASVRQQLVGKLAWLCSAL